MAVHSMMVMGVDGCKAGWIAVMVPGGDPGLAHVQVAASFDELLAVGMPNVIAVDMPIGLPPRIGPGGRAAEIGVRHFIGARRSSVFAIPSRGAVYAPDYASARLAALATSDPPRSISKQAWNIFPKIRELDRLLCQNAGLAACVRECHPEASFCALAGAPLSFTKKQPEGASERRQLLIAAGFSEAFLRFYLPRGVAQDDFLDACAAAWTAMRLSQRTARSFPFESELDDFGLRMAIWA